MTLPLPMALVLALLSGAAGLAHQILWTRRMVDVLGANSDTFAKVIGIFFVGLALGAWVTTRVAGACHRGDGDWWGRVALAELAVALLALPMLGAAVVADRLMVTAAGPELKWMLPLLLIGPPAMAMGLVIPWMIRALTVNARFRPHHATLLYAANTVGGIVGISVGLGFALPRWGLNGASQAAIALNLVVAAGAYALHGAGNRRTTSAAGVADDSSRAIGDATAPSASRSILRWSGAAAFASGFLVLALEVLIQTQLAQVTINSFFSSAVVLTMVLMALTAAALLTPWLLRSSQASSCILPLGVASTALLCAAQPFLLNGLRGGLEILPYELALAPYAAQVLQLGLLAVVPVFLAAGLLFPMLLHATADGAATDSKAIGRLFFWNGLGGWLGAELTQAWIAPTFGLWTGVGVIATGYWVTMLILWPRQAEVGPAGPPLYAKVMAGAAALAVTGGLMLAPSLPQARLNSGERLVEVATGREGVVATLECGPEDRRMLFNNSYTLGGSRARFNQERQGLLPLLLHENPERVATLGVATGSTVAGTTLDPRVRQIDAIELSPLVLHQAATHFRAFNRDVLHDSRVRLHQEDARWVMARQVAQYDVVVGDLFLPWRTGEGRLFTLEHFRNVRRSLKPRGLYCQWLPLFQLTRSQFDTIARTFALVFPGTFVVRGDFYSELPILGLVGGRPLDQVNWDALAGACGQLVGAGQVLDPLVRHPEGVAMMLVGPLPDPGKGSVNTLGNAWLEWDAGRNILGLRSPWFVGVPYGEYVRDAQRQGALAMPEELRNAQDAGQFFLTLEIAAKLQHPQLDQLIRQARERLPASLRNDGGADWREWPMRLKPKLAAPE